MCPLQVVFIPCIMRVSSKIRFPASPRGYMVDHVTLRHVFLAVIRSSSAKLIFVYKLLLLEGRKGESWKQKIDPLWKSESI